MIALFLAGPTGLTAQSVEPPADRSGESILGVYEGRTPCGTIAVEFTGFPAQNCEKIKWRLTLFRNRATLAPTTYLYQGTRATRRGVWTIGRGTPESREAVVYHLQLEPRGTVVSFQRVDANILLLLDARMRPVVGDASWSYTLSRTR